MSKRGADWYKREPRAFLEGVRRLTEREIAVYAVVLDLIYDGGHQTQDDPKHIASYFSDVGSAAVRRAIDSLVDAGKLIRQDGFLTNKRAQNEGKTREELKKTRQKIGHLGGVSSGKSRSQINENKDIAEPIADIHAREDKIRLDKREEDKSSSLSETSSDEKPKSKKRLSYPEQFEAFWKAYPTDRNMAKKEAFDAWKKLDAEDRAACLAAVPGYRELLKRKPTLETLHACRFITKRRFEGYAPEPPQSVDEAAWIKRLNYGRREGKWASDKWGPAPKRAGCLVPENLLQPDDGAGWREMEQTA
ncbi:DUF1376 domain-containing protein [Ensifer aridi]|uniref:DUF1376 domain-containing protein n=1 Tax=Ensifer aridi TaxID=1708715 RepID=UPI000A1196A1|nr:DUF1376 domain-containing protein [Ensifer aridi]